MFRRIFTITGLPALTLLVSVLASSPAAAQNQGYSVWAHRYDGGGGGGYGRAYYRSQTYAPVYAPPVAVYSDQETERYYTALSPSSSPVSEQTVTINVSLPSSGKIWFNDAPTTQTGPDRSFVSPTITPGKDYVYTVRASWTEGGRKVERTKDIAVHAGDRINLDFTKGS
jgi:uncharacterized protein (TIGR03000 family)